MRLLVTKSGFSNSCHFSLQEQKPTRKRKCRGLNYVDSKFQQQWKSHETIWRTTMLSLIGGWASTKTDQFVSQRLTFFSPSQHLLEILLSLWLFKLLYRCLATTDLLVGLVVQPLYAAYLMSVVQEQWSLCRYYAVFITGSVLFLVSLMTMTAISVDRLLALMLGLRY